MFCKCINPTVIAISIYEWVGYYRFYVLFIPLCFCLSLHLENCITEIKDSVKINLIILRLSESEIHQCVKIQSLVKITHTHIINHKCQLWEHPKLRSDEWTTVVRPQLLKVRNRMGICSRGQKLHAKLMVAVWGIKIWALTAPVQGRWSYTITHSAPEDKPQKTFYCNLHALCSLLC